MRREWTFDNGRNGFAYQDDVFRFTSAPDQASGVYARRGGRDDGALTVKLEGDAASGAWRKSFLLDETQPVELSFRYRIDLPREHEARERAEVRVELDGETVRLDGRGFIEVLSGGGDDRSTGWERVTIALGELEAGRHVLKLGGFAEGPADAAAKVVLDEVAIASAGRKFGAFEARVLELTNDFREEHGLEPLGNDRRLNAAAEDWSRTMAERDFFRHSTPEQVEDHGYDPRRWGENIAAGYPYSTPEEVVEGWIASPGHRANLLGRQFEEIGIGYYFRENDGGDAPYGHYWTQAFGTEADSLV